MLLIIFIRIRNGADHLPRFSCLQPMKRPLFFVTLLVLLSLNICRLLGMPGVTEQTLEKCGLKLLLTDRTLQTDIRILGRVSQVSRGEQDDPGTTCLVKDFLILVPNRTIGQRQESIQLNLKHWTQVTIEGVTYQGLALRKIAADPISDMSVKVTLKVSAGDHDFAMTDGDLRPGDYGLFSGNAYLPEEPDNPGQFDLAEYHRSRQILFCMKDGQVRRQHHRVTIAGILDRIGYRLQQALQSSLTEEDAALLGAILLGDKEGLPEEIRDTFSEGGISHILAISGLHISLLAMGLYRLLRRMKLSFQAAGLISSVAIFLYCLMTGMSISAQRAMIMFMLEAGAQVCGRSTDMLTSLSVASLVLLLRYPDYLADGGFWLSYGCMASLELLTPLCRRLLKKSGVERVLVRRSGPLDTLGKAVNKGLRSGLAIQMGTAPLVLWFFYQLTPWSLLVNLLVIPAMSLVMISGLLSCSFGVVFPEAGTLLGAPAHYLARFFVFLCKLESKLPGHVLIWGRPRLWQVVGYYMLLAVLVVIQEKKTMSSVQRRQVRSLDVYRLCGHKVLRVGIVLGLVWMLIYRPHAPLEIHAISIGQGDNLLIRYQNKNFLIDCGSSTVERCFRYRTKPVLKYYGISRIDGWFLTHGDQDHIGGAQEYLDEGCEIPVRAVITAAGARNVDQALDEVCKGFENACVDTWEMEAGKWLQIKGRTNLDWIPGRMSGRKAGEELTLTCLYPSRSDLSEETNQNSLVLKLDWGEFSILFTGDLEKEGEEKFVKRYRRSGLGKIRVLKCGHHGSKNATSTALLDVLQPQAAIFSCGKFNAYGHPSKQAIKRLKEAGVRYYRTDYQGEVTVIPKKDGAFVVDTYRKQ